MDFAARRLSGTDPWLNLALEEACLRRGGEDGALLLIYVNDACLVVGRNQNPWTEVAPDAGLPVLRRVSGGGTVYHDSGNLNWSLIVPRRVHDTGAELGLVAAALGRLGVRVGPGARGGLYILEGPFAGRKLSGTARRLEAAWVLHHGTLLVDADLGRLTRSLGGMRATDSRALPSVPGLPVNLAQILPGVGVDEVALALAGSISGRAPASLGCAELEVYAAEARARLRSWEWTYGATPPFSVAARLGGRELSLSVRDGLVASIEGGGAEAYAQLIGKAFDPSLAGA